MRRNVRVVGPLVCWMLAATLFAQQRTPADGSGVDERFFVEKVYPVFEKAECRTCHNDNGVSSATRLRFPPLDAKTEAIQVFGLKLSALVDRGNVPQSLLLNKPTLRAPHTGGERIAKDSPEEAVVHSWATHLAALTDVQIGASIERLTPGRREAAKPGALRRLTHSQYNNTVRDLLGDFTRPADQFPPEDFLHGFTNQVEGQSVPPLLAEAYMVAAEKLAANAFRRGDGQKLIPCKPGSANDRVCRDRFIRTFGLRAFRRPLTDKEIAGYGELFGEAAGQGDFLAGAKVVVEAMLQSPSFLFHLEAGPAGRWRQYGIASRLSYFLWDTMPGDELLRAAEAGELARPEDIKKVAARMMDNPQAKRALEVFLAQWMRFDRVLGSARNVRRYPDFGASLLAAMTEETKHLFNDLVWNHKNFMEMFSAGYTFLSPRLAQLYEMQAPAQDFGMVKYPDGGVRAGVLGHAGFLTLTGSPTETSPTSRGLFVREHFLCQNVPPPPPGVDTNLPPVTDKPMTNRERLEIHLSNQSCASCHTLIDPIGLGLENFDNIGRYREKFALQIQQQRDAVTNERRPAKEFQLDLDTKGYIQGIASSGFSSAKELGNILANDPTCQRCMVKQIFRYATGRHETESDQPDLNALFEVFRESGFRFRELMLAVVISRPFLDSGVEPVEISGKSRRNP
ncbi:MAG: DUF1592 domain-containing protein [Bryobacteraceae bacterium]